jgi:hypothetical protein
MTSCIRQGCDNPCSYPYLTCSRECRRILIADHICIECTHMIPNYSGIYPKILYVCIECAKSSNARVAQIDANLRDRIARLKLKCRDLEDEIYSLRAKLPQDESRKRERSVSPHYRRSPSYSSYNLSDSDSPRMGTSPSRGELHK